MNPSETLFLQTEALAGNSQRLFVSGRKIFYDGSVAFFRAMCYNKSTEILTQEG